MGQVHGSFPPPPFPLLHAGSRACCGWSGNELQSAAAPVSPEWHHMQSRSQTDQSECWIQHEKDPWAPPSPFQSQLWPIQDSACSGADGTGSTIGRVRGGCPGLAPCRCMAGPRSGVFWACPAPVMCSMQVNLSLRASTGG